MGKYYPSLKIISDNLHLVSNSTIDFNNRSQIGIILAVEFIDVVSKMRTPVVLPKRACYSEIGKKIPKWEVMIHLRKLKKKPRKLPIWETFTLCGENFLFRFVDIAVK